VTDGPSVWSSICHSKGLKRLTRNNTTLTPMYANITHIQISYDRGFMKEKTPGMSLTGFYAIKQGHHCKTLHLSLLLTLAVVKNWFTNFKNPESGFTSTISVPEAISHTRPSHDMTIVFHHRQRGSTALLTAAPQPNWKGQDLTPTESKPLNRVPKNWQSWFGPRDDLMQNSVISFNRDFWANGWNIMFYDFFSQALRSNALTHLWLKHAESCKEVHCDILKFHSY